MSDNGANIGLMQQGDGQGLEGGGDFFDDERVVFRAEFDDRLIAYKVAFTILTVGLTIWFIPFLLISLPCLIYAFKANLRSRELIITEKTLVYKQGYFGCCCMCWNESSKHVPLEKVTDITYSQGCLERSYGLATIQIQTAGQNGPDGRPELRITGIVDAANFRKIVMAAKAQHMATIYGGSAHTAIPIGAKGQSYGATSGAAVVSGGDGSESTEALKAMRDTMIRIESHVKNIDAALAARVPPSSDPMV